jgi:hypothetical protein
MLWFKYCPQQAAPALILLFANPACVTLSVSEAYSRCPSGCLRRPSFQSAASAAGAASSTSLPFFLFFITPAPMQYPMGRWRSNFVWHPCSECRTQPTVISNPFRAVLFICYTPAQRLGFSRTAPLQWCLSPMYTPADTAYRRRHAEPACLHFLQASLASPALHGSTLSGSIGCLHCQILLLLSRHPAFHGRCQSLHIILPNEPAACGTWSRLVVSR